jgi:hypothetical protein
MLVPEACPGIAKDNKISNKCEYRIHPYKRYLVGCRGEPGVHPLLPDSLLKPAKKFNFF